MVNNDPTSVKVYTNVVLFFASITGAIFSYSGASELGKKLGMSHY